MFAFPIPIISFSLGLRKNNKTSRPLLFCRNYLLLKIISDTGRKGNLVVALVYILYISNVSKSIHNHHHHLWERVNVHLIE